METLVIVAVLSWRDFRQGRVEWWIDVVTLSAFFATAVHGKCKMLLTYFASSKISKLRMFQSIIAALNSSLMLEWSLVGSDVIMRAASLTRPYKATLTRLPHNLYLCAGDACAVTVAMVLKCRSHLLLYIIKACPIVSLSCDTHDDRHATRVSV